MKLKIGIDLGGSHIGVGIIEGGEIVYKVEKDLQNYEKGTLNIIELIKKIISAIIKQYNKKIEDIELIGIACPGISENGIITNANNLNIENIDFKKELGKEYKNIKINVRNDAKCAALAEKKYGSLKDVDNAVMLTIGTGIGGAVFYNGQLLHARGSSGYEFGHMIIEKDGKKCSCGSNGCFEAYASIGNFRKEVKENLKIKEDITGKELLEILQNREKEEKVKQLINEYTKNLAIGISSIINIFEPEVIALGGSIVYYKDIILPKLENYLKNENYIFNKERVPKILMAILNNDAGMIGTTIEKKVIM